MRPIFEVVWAHSPLTTCRPPAGSKLIAARPCFTWRTLCIVEVVASPAAVEFVREHGGKLFVWSRARRCCGGAITVLEAATERDDRPGFRPVPADGIELYVDLPRLPEQLEIDVRGRFHPKVSAYWEGCAWVI